MLAVFRRSGRFAVLLAMVVAACAQGENKTSVDATPIIDAYVPDACVPQTEVCNGKDDDCDAKTDEGFVGLGDTCSAGVGACTASGHLVCKADGTAVVCDAQPGDMTTEKCDTIDNDCDSKTDEEFMLGTLCDGGDADLCSEGMIVCDATGGTMCSDATDDSVEMCNAADDDCDMKTDEGFDVGAQCDGTDSDVCKEGMIMCNDTGGAVCGDITGDSLEKCNGIDDDCLGGIDNGYDVGTACSAGVGACMRMGTKVCNSMETGTLCDAVAGSPSAETCGDGIDRDCNGADISCPINDTGAGAVDISAGGTFTVDLGAARDDQADTGIGCGISGGRDVFYKFTLSAAEVVYFDTFGSDFDSVLRIYAGSCTALGTRQTCFDDACAVRQSQGAIQLTAGSYCLVVDQFSSTQTTGATVLTFTHGGRTGAAITPVSGSVSGDTTNTTNQSTSSSCQANVTGNDQGYYFLNCPATTRMVSAETCTTTSFDTIVTLRKGNATTTDLACSDDDCALQSNLPDITINTAGLYWFIVDGYLGAKGPFSLAYSFL